MDTIRCNMCGNDNPIEAEYCQFCNAKLIKNQGQFEASQEASEESLSDWLGKLREDSTDNVHKETSYDEQISSTPDNNETLQADNSTDDDTPVWLDRIRSLNQIDNGSSIEETKIEDESDDQFLSSSEKVRQWLEDLKLQDGEKEEEELDIKLDHEEISPPLVSEEEISVNNIADGDIDLGKNDTNAAEDKIFEFETLSDDINIESDQSSDEISIPEFQEDIPEDNEVFNSSIIDDAIKQIQFSQDETLNIVNKHTVSDKPDDQTDPGKIEDSVTDQNDILENDDEISLPTPAFSGKDLPDWLG